MPEFEDELENLKYDLILYLDHEKDNVYRIPLAKRVAELAKKAESKEDLIKFKNLLIW